LRRYAPAKTRDEYSANAGGGPFHPSVLCISNLNLQKRIDVLLEAFSQVSKVCPAAVCNILGAGPLESELKEKAEALGVGGTVMFRGRVNDIRPYLEAADLFVLSSDKEGLPLSLGESMAYGIPSVVTDAGGNREIVVDGETGYIVPTGSPGQLAERILYLLTHEEDRRRMGENARRRVAQYFDMNSTMDELARLVLREARVRS
jgi:glycosyltransferase involved in cell wall biosynthesis